MATAERAGWHYFADFICKSSLDDLAFLRKSSVRLARHLELKKLEVSTTPFQDRVLEQCVCSEGHILFWFWPSEQKFSCEVFLHKPFNTQSVTDFLQRIFSVSRYWSHQAHRLWPS